MPDLQVSPLLLALVTSLLGTALLVWHRHGGARWMFAVGGFLFILGRVMIVALCAVVIVVITETMLQAGTEALGVGAVFAIAILAICGWSILVVVRAVRRDAFGSAGEEAARDFGDRTRRLTSASDSR